MIIFGPIIQRDFPRGMIYFILGLFYGLVPISNSSICFLKPFKKNQMIMGLGIVSGSLSGATGTIWVFNKVKDHEKILFNGEGMVKRVEIYSLQV
jgi:hypothetical protein